MWFLFRFLLFGGILAVAVGLEIRMPRRKRSSELKPVIIEDTVCTGACFNLLRISTESDESFRDFLQLASLGSVVPQTMISHVDLLTFQRYCLNIYTPVRECLIACSSNFTADLLKNMTMLETMCVDYYQEMNRYITCMKYAYEKTGPICESKCFASSTDQSTNATTEMTILDNNTSETNSSLTDVVVKQSDQSFSMKPNETMALFCILLDCVTLCEIPLVEKECGRDAAVLEAVLIDAMARTEKITVQLEESDLWPKACDNLILPTVTAGETRWRPGLAWILILLTTIFSIRDNY